MKVNVEIDCTPLEARQFFGLPDVAPMQTAVMDSFDPKLAERFQELFVAMAGLGGALTGDKKK